MPAIRLPNDRLLIPVELDDPAEGIGWQEIGPDHPDYPNWLASAEDGDDPRPNRAKPEIIPLEGLEDI